jgi:hypothetical protein
MNLKKMFYLGVVSFIVMNAHAGQYLDYQINYMQQASVEEANENDVKASDTFASLAAKAAQENRYIKVLDLPENWQTAPQNGRTPEHRDRLLELESAIASMGSIKRENHAEQVARLQVCLFHVRHEMSESTFRGKTSDADTARYMACAETAYEKILNQPPVPVIVSDDLPPANPGECYARVYTPTVYKVEQYEVLKKPASFRVQTVPAVYATVEERRLVKEAATKVTEIAAVYETVEETIVIKEAATKISEQPVSYKTIEERILVKEASTLLKEVPAVYEWIEERVIDTPAHTAWKEGGKIVEKIDGTTGQAVCLVEVPATYKTLRKHVLKTPGTTRTTEVPAEYKTVSKQIIDKAATTKVTEIPAQLRTIEKRVVKTPATTKVIEIPAEYTVYNVQKLVTPATTREIPIVAEYEKVTKTHIVTPSKMEWRQVLCDINLTVDRISRLQEALAKAGYDPGTSRGKLNTETLDVITQFQQDNKLGTGGITLETVRLLETDI